MTKEEFLLDGISYYGENPAARRCTDEIRCRYSPFTINKQATSQGCFIGRHLSARDAKFCDDKSAITILDVQRLLGNRFPVWLNELGIDFLHDCQSLHDESSYWEEKGLFLSGKETVNEIIKKYNLNIPLYEITA